MFVCVAYVVMLTDFISYITWKKLLGMNYVFMITDTAGPVPQSSILKQNKHLMSRIDKLNTDFR